MTWISSPTAVAVVALVGVALAAAGVWYARKQLFPVRRRLVVSSPGATALLTEDSRLAGLEILRNGAPLTDPHLVSVTLRNTGTHDIANSAYNTDTPLEINFGTAVVDILKSQLLPTRSDSPQTAKDGSIVRIEPFLLSRRQRLTIQVLTDGPVATGFLPTNFSHQLIDVEVDYEDSDRIGSRAVRFGAALTILAALVSLAAVVAAAALTRADDEPSACRPNINERSFANPPVEDRVIDLGGGSAPRGGVATRSEPCAERGEDSVVSRLSAGDSVLIRCQARGETINDTTDIWNYLSDGTWVSDFYIQGTRVDQFAPHIPRCDGST